MNPIFKILITTNSSNGDHVKKWYKIEQELQEFVEQKTAIYEEELERYAKMHHDSFEVIPTKQDDEDFNFNKHLNSQNPFLLQISLKNKL
jgi:hypothetical protein